jgi:phage baseplate assembly protein W
MSNRFVGAGWSFPLRFEPSGGLELVAGDREIQESIEIILRTAPGERWMRPEFGCAVHDEVFGPIDNAAAGRIERHVTVALDRWEPRIDVLGVDVLFDEIEQGRLLIRVRFSIRGTYDPRSLVFPFYVIPDEQPSLPTSPVSGVS